MSGHKPVVVKLDNGTVNLMKRKDNLFMVTLKKLTEVVNHIVNEKIEIEEISPDTKIEFEVESDVDAGTLDGGCYFNDLADAYNYLSELLEMQTNPDCLQYSDDFKKIHSVSLCLHFNSDDICIVLYRRVSDTEFIGY